jgi:quinol monooxygenase YgiN
MPGRGGDAEGALLRAWEVARATPQLFRTTFHNTVVEPIGDLLERQFDPDHSKMKRKPLSATVPPVRKPVNRDEFNFTKVNDREVLLYTDEATYLVNVSPLWFGHMLLVPSCRDVLPQVLTPEGIAVALKSLKRFRPSVRLMFNSMAAWASVNHLHLHIFFPALPVVRFRKVEVREDQSDARRVLTETAEHARSDPGCLRFDLLNDRASPNTFLSYEVFASRAALDAHEKRPYAKACSSLLDEAVETTTLFAEGIDIDPGARPLPNSGVALFETVTDAEGRLPIFLAGRFAAIDDHRRQGGCADLVRVTSTPNTYLTYEVFESFSELDAHLGKSDAACTAAIGERSRTVGEHALAFVPLKEYAAEVLPVERAPRTEFPWSTDTLCVEKVDWVAPCVAFSGSRMEPALATFISALVDANVPHNAVMGLERTYVFPRPPQAETFPDPENAEPGAGMHWACLELAGRAVCLDEPSFRALDSRSFAEMGTVLAFDYTPYLEKVCHGEGQLF